MGVSKKVRAGAILILGGTALISYHMVALLPSDRMLTNSRLKFPRTFTLSAWFSPIALGSNDETA